MSGAGGAEGEGPSLIRLELSYEQITTILASINCTKISILDGKWTQVLDELYLAIYEQRKAQAAEKKDDD